MWERENPLLPSGFEPWIVQPVGSSYTDWIIRAPTHSHVRHHNADKIAVPIPVAARSKALVCRGSPAGIVGSNPAGGIDVCLLWVMCVVRGFCVGLMPRPEIPTACVVSECDRETSIMRRPWPYWRSLRHVWGGGIANKSFADVVKTKYLGMNVA